MGVLHGVAGSLDINGESGGVKGEVPFGGEALHRSGVLVEQN